MHWSVVGHDRIKQYFSKALREGFSSHTIVLAGPDGIGKRTLVIDVIRAAHGGAEPGVNDPFSVVISPNDKGTISKKEHIEPMQRLLSLRPPDGTHTFVLINDAHRLSFDASHAILKILEEPPAHAVFILVSALPGQLPATVRSRCLQLRCVPPRTPVVQEFLRQQGVSDAPGRELARISGGSIGWLNEVLEQKTEKQVLANIQKWEATLAMGRAERLAWAKAMSKEDLPPVVLQWMHYTRARLSDDVHAATTAHALLALYESLGQNNLNTRLSLEHFVLTVR